ncbi:MAG: cofactor-independent phosphoglycerate mutase [Pseudomonadota bacterium]
MTTSAYIILLGDGMGDYPLAELGGKTPLEAAATPNLDRLAREGELGLVQTVPEGMAPGSDVANMAILGYDPRRYLTGRAPLEAAAMGVALAPDEVAFRCNLVSLSGEPPDRTMEDYSAGHITTEEAARIVQSLGEGLNDTEFTFYAGVSYRHLLVWKGGFGEVATTPPHDITGRKVAPYLEKINFMVLLELMERAGKILADHPVNHDRRQRGLRPANSIWLWGQGFKPAMPTLAERFGLTGAVVSAVDLLRGIGRYVGLEPLVVPGMTGWLDTNHAGKVDAALGALGPGKLIYLHVEAPDEASHSGSLADKLRAIENFDRLVVGPVSGRLPAGARLMALTDHFTPLSTKTHSSEPVPYVIWGEGVAASGAKAFSERQAAQGPKTNEGYALLDRFLAAEKS